MNPTVYEDTPGNLTQSVYIASTKSDQRIVGGLFATPVRNSRARVDTAPARSLPMRLTKTVVDHATVPEHGQRFLRDTALPGFALRVTSGGAKSFVLEKRINGRVRRQTLGRYGALTVEQARREAQKVLGRIAAGADPIAERREAQARSVTLGEAFEAYLAARKDLRATTLRDYRQLMGSAFKDWHYTELAALTKDKIARRHAKLGERSHARANNAMRLLRAVYNFASYSYEDSRGRSLFPENPVRRLNHTRAWYPVERRRTYIKRGDLPAWFEAVQALRADEADPNGRSVADYLLLLLFTGLRRGEAMRLRWREVDFVARTVTIPDTKNHDPLVLPHSDFIYDLLFARHAMDSSAWVFPGTGPQGYLIEPRRQMAKIITQSGVSFTLHDLRRTFITVAESLDISIYAIKRLVNHRIRNDVTAGYIVMAVERLRGPMQKITDHLRGLAGETASASAAPMPRRGG